MSYMNDIKRENKLEKIKRRSNSLISWGETHVPIHDKGQFRSCLLNIIRIIERMQNEDTKH